MRTRLLFPAAMLLSGCMLHRRSVVPEPTRSPARDSLFQLDQSRGDSVAARGPVDGMLALLAPVVVYLRAGVPAVYGRDGARVLLAATVPEAREGVTWQPLGGGVARDLRAAYTWGVTARVTPPRVAPRLERYVAYWERGAGQPWRITAYAEVDGRTSADPHLARASLEPPTVEPAEPMAKGITQLRAADSLFADLADRMGTAFAFSHTVAPEGVVFGATQLVIGPRAVLEYFTAEDAGRALAWHPVYATIAGSLDLGFTIGEYSVTSRGPSGAAVQRFGKHLTVWERQPDGRWKVVVDAGSSAPGRIDER